MDDLVGNAADLARRHLDTPALADRWRHVQAVAQRAGQLVAAVDLADRSLLVAAAWLHDIGYAPELAETGMHAIDGARHLQHSGYPLRLAALVAHHSGARFEAAERGLTHALDEFTLEDGPVPDALATADLTTGPQGQAMTFDARMTEILHRYPPRSSVHQAMLRARPTLAVQVARTADRLRRTNTAR
ncbi:HD domain-containing protein [Dactylosporangium sp. NPDC051485]|uniref:HD domain-containing protein n=1 Tax=Dactylosporangium sp. NPDC051485 TaxID=3154846 RepID=UPI003421896B